MNDFEIKQMRTELDGLHDTVEVLLACIGKEMHADYDCCDNDCCNDCECCVSEEE